MPKCPHCRQKLTRFDEFDIRSIDEFGDAQNVDSCATLAEAMTHANPAEFIAGTCAVAIERHYGVCCNNAECEFPGIVDDEYEDVATAGSKSALLAGGWIES